MKRDALIVLTVVVALLAVLGLNPAVFAGRTAEPAAPLAGAPTVVSYQGQVIVAGAAYSGTGYFKFAVADQPACTTSYWMNDGSPASGAAPTAAVSLTVSNGLFNVLLGDTTLTNMTALPASVFSGTTRYLRVWFSSDNVTFTLLTPDRRIAAVPYACRRQTLISWTARKAARSSRSTTTSSWWRRAAATTPPSAPRWPPSAPPRPTAT